MALILGSQEWPPMTNQNKGWNWSVEPWTTKYNETH